MRIGTICYATEQGLGILAKSFYDHGVITDVLVLKHQNRRTITSWYPDSDQISVKDLNTGQVRKFLAELDAYLIFETPFNWNLINYCKTCKVRTVLVPMYECMPQRLPVQPDYFICPSKLDLQYYPNNSEYLPIPVEVTWRQRKIVKSFIHNAGNLGLRERNGTRQLLEAMRYVKSPLWLIVRSQCNRAIHTHALPKMIHEVNGAVTDQRILYEMGTYPYDELWEDGDVFVWPDKFNGLSLPLQEARASGMLVMGTNRFPANDWLPNEPLIPVSNFNKARVSSNYNEFEEAVVDPTDIARTMDEWYSRDITEYSTDGKQWADEMSWRSLKPKWLKAIHPQAAAVPV